MEGPRGASGGEQDAPATGRLAVGMYRELVRVDPIDPRVGEQRQTALILEPTRGFDVQQLAGRVLGLKVFLGESAGMEENEIRAAAGGGLMGLAVEDEFSGIVEGEGHGMEDNIRMPIKEEGEEVGTLAVSPKEYVVDSHTMSALGNGNPDEGADIMDEFVENIREEAFGTIEQPNEIDGLASLQSMLERV